MSSILVLNSCVLTALFCWGAWGIFDKLALKQAPALVVMVCLCLFAVPSAIVCLIWLNLTSPGWSLTPEILLWNILGFLSYGTATIFYLQAMAMGEASYVLGATACYPILLQFLSASFLGESVVPERLIGSILVGIGVAAIGFSKSANQVQLNRKESTRLLILVILAAFLWGIWGIFDKKAVIAGGPAISFLAHCLCEIAILVPLGIWSLYKYKNHFFKGGSLWRPVTSSALCLKIGGITYLIAMSMATASYVIVITGCYPMIMYILALSILKEKFNRLRLAGIVLVTVGGIVCQATQGL
jgi:uncharacterized membrane protein